ncbi:MAG TPA: response regulator [Pseudacidobacterium sp.]|jgi:two-component system chemotaxis response regulator CheY|nr:response regulator [Pseudacidobacterium sp.]
MRALIVDDSGFIRNYLHGLLEGRGLECVEADNGQAAIDAVAKSGSFDLALVDVNMPVMNGLEFVKALRENLQQKETKVVMVTTEADHAFIEAALEAGADEYLMKPFDEASLMEKLQMIGLVA